MTFTELAKEIQEEHKKRLKDGDEEIITDGKEYILNKLEKVYRRTLSVMSSKLISSTVCRWRNGPAYG